MSADGSPRGPAGPWTRPERLSAALHASKVYTHILLRTFRNLRSGAPRRLKPSARWIDTPVLAEQRSSLWLDGRDDEFVLRCGKVQNLRVVARAFNGLEAGAGEVVSFWSQVGRPSAWRGFAVGREVVTGCVVPTIGGGICQLSNALASAAQSAGIRLVEHHRHTARIEGKRPDASVDATVAWNYIDLRLVADFPFRIEAELTAEELVVRIRRPEAVPVPLHLGEKGPVSVSSEPYASSAQAAPVARGCLTCDETACFRHGQGPERVESRMAVLVNEKSPELEQWLRHHARGADWMAPWVHPSRRIQAWKTPAEGRFEIARGASWRRMLARRLAHARGATRQEGGLLASSILARAYGRMLKPEHTRLVVAQDLLVPLWRSGALGGRSFDVFVPELPASEIQRRLDAALSARPEAHSLHDFRVDTAWQRDEWAAIAAAQRRLTPHLEVRRALDAAGLSVDFLPWMVPGQVAAPRPARSSGKPATLVFAGSALARKGALEVAEVARNLNVRVLILGSSPTHPDEWAGVHWSRGGAWDDWIATADVVVLPAHVEHRPRTLLRALAAGLPVVASAACGLGAHPQLIEIPPGDVHALEAAVRKVLATSNT